MVLNKDVDLRSKSHDLLESLNQSPVSLEGGPVGCILVRYHKLAYPESQGIKAKDLVKSELAIAVMIAGYGRENPTCWRFIIAEDVEIERLYRLPKVAKVSRNDNIVADTSGNFDCNQRHIIGLSLNAFTSRFSRGPIGS
jgi:hypothetical protein